MVDERICLKFNRASWIRWLRALFRLASRLGDGVFWYALTALLPALHRAAAPPAVLHMVAAGLACTVTQKLLKAKTSRRRPFQVNPQIICSAAPLDRFSFPSGHTLHAHAFTTVALWDYPNPFLAAVPFYPADRPFAHGTRPALPERRARRHRPRWLVAGLTLVV